jgi:hypothetical protein
MLYLEKLLKEDGFDLCCGVSIDDNEKGGCFIVRQDADVSYTLGKHWGGRAMKQLRDFMESEPVRENLEAEPPRGPVARGKIGKRKVTTE